MPVTTYVYKLRGQCGLLYSRTPHPNPLFGLTADSEDELHAFAARLGLGRNLYQAGKQAGPQQVPATGHYYLTEGERDHAVTIGAEAITPRQKDKMDRQRAAWLGDS